MAILSKKKKKRHLKDISSIISNILFLCSYHVYFILRNKSKERVTEGNKRFNLQSLQSLHSLFLKILSIRNQTFLTLTQRKIEEVLKLVRWLPIILFLNNRSIVHFCGWKVDGSWWFVDIIILWFSILKRTLLKKQHFLLWCPCYSETAILAS